jgi:benzoyl-CoA reductase/2-hydroxyglutaryl-CoA dehydratase subunit BcrC/BadD/HgdB
MKDLGAPLLSIVDGRRAASRRIRGPQPHFGPPLRCNARLKKLLTRHYFMSRYAEGARPVAWVTSGAPVELLRVFDFYTVYPENHGALCGAKRMGTELCAAAERQGYSRELCAYARIDLGHHFTGKTPAGRLPRPDLLFACNNICQTVVYWFRSLAHYWDIPLVLVDTPFNFETPSDLQNQYVAAQLEETIPVLERVSAQRFDLGRLQHVIGLAKDTAALWGEVLDTLKARPAPMTIFDAFAHLAPIVSLRGLAVTRTYYRMLLEELRERVDRGIGALTVERKRLMWDNIAIWFKARELAGLFAERGLNFVTATYTNAWAETGAMIEPQRPFESLAKAYSRIILNNNLKGRLQLMERLIEDFGVDGLVMHSARSCKPYSIGQYDLKRALTDHLQIPSVIVEADIADARAYSDKQVATQLGLFFEALEHRDVPRR